MGTSFSMTERLVSPLAVDHAVSGPPQGQWTIVDWEKLPEDGNRYEVIDGWLYMTTAPSNFHQWVVQQLAESLGIPARQQRQGVYFVAPIGVLLPTGQAVQPDFVLITQANVDIIREGRIRGVPDLVVEVLLPGNSAYEMQTRQTIYAEAGVPEYGVVDLRTRTLCYYHLTATGAYDAAQVFAEEAIITFACVPAVPLAVANLFADAPDTTIHVQP